MIQQTAIGLDSRSNANPYNEGGFLPIITAPMYSVVNEENYQIFLDNKIQVCLSRNITFPNMRKFNGFVSYSLEDFKKYFINLTSQDYLPKICIDTANGNIPALHDAIRKAKEIHGDKLIIMTGNVASVEAFVELAKTGVDYIRVGVGGGGGCNTTSNTGVGQLDLDYLIKECSNVRKNPTRYNLRSTTELEGKDLLNLMKVKIVADGISTYIKQCETRYGFNDNGYAAINKLLFAGADLVMVGKLFAQCVESAGDKTSEFRLNRGEKWVARGKAVYEIWNDETEQMIVKYSGMSTQEEQKKYKKWVPKNGEEVQIKVFSNWSKGTYIGLDVDRINHLVRENNAGGSHVYKSEQIRPITEIIKPSEGSVNWILVRWSLKDWLLGSEDQDTYPYLMGWVNSIKSAMSYTNKTTL